MSPRAAAGVIAGIVLAIGFIVGCVPQSIPIDYRNADGETTVSCGSAFGSDGSDAKLAEFGSDIRAAYRGQGIDGGGDFVSQCASELTTPRVIAWVLMGLGALGGLFLFLTSRQSLSQLLVDGGMSPPDHR